mgnify:CR=1 FL=1
MKKRLLALLLCLVMVIGLVPVALADGSETGSTGTVTEPVEGENPPVSATRTRTIIFKAKTEDVDVIYDLGSCKVTFAEGSNSTTLAENNCSTANYTKPGYTVGTWYQGGYGSGDPLTDNTGIGYSAEHPEKVVYALLTAKDHTISFEYTGDVPEGFTAPVSVTKKTNDTVELNTPTDIPAGYIFDGWYVGSQKIDGTTYTVPEVDAATITLTGKWHQEFTVTYKKDASSTGSDVKEVKVVKGSVYTAATCDWTAPAGKEFVHWVTADGSKVYKAGQSLGAITGDVTLIAVFKNKTETTYDVTFNCNYHDKKETITVPANTKLIIDPNYGTYAGSTTKTTITVTSDTTIADAKRAGYYFYGWYVTKSQGVYTFTAVWNNNYYYNSYSIYYYDYDDCKSEYANFPYGTSVVIDPNGGTAKLSGTSFSTKQSFNIYRDYTLTDASRSGYTFYGWDLTKSGSTYYFTAMWSRYKSDVPYMLNGTDHYAYIKGYPNGSFKPTDTITRAEAATIFYRLLTDSTRKAYATTYNSFKDVPATAWYNTAVSTMAKLGIVNGGADGYFRPNDPITRAEIAAMIARCDGAYYTGTSTVFSDTYGHWAAGYIDRAYELGWINGYGTTYAPDRYISRAETVAVLNRVLNRAPQYTSDLTRNYTTFSDVATSAWYYLDVEEAANSHTYTRKTNDYEYWDKLISDPSWL